MIDIDESRKVIEALHGGKAIFLESVLISDIFEGRPWQGTVHVFDFVGHPAATRAYAWATAKAGSTERCYQAVLAISPIVSPRAAVRAVIVAERRQK